MEHKNAKQILLKYQSGMATEEEKAVIESWMLHGSFGELPLTDEELLHDLTEIRQRLNIGNEPVKTMRLWPRWVAAASVIIMLSVGAYFVLRKPQQLTAQLHNDIAPGGYKATLTLANGNQIDLTEAKYGMLAKQGQTVINKTAAGQVVYRANNNAGGAITYNTITSPRAGKWSVVLPDGTKAWLDALSSIHFPTAFTAKTRVVEITGQVYFEVAHNAAKQFSVIANGQTVQDIGTHFNISAYTDEPSIKTTLLEGSVKIIKGDQNVVLKPGQQAAVTPTGKKIMVENIDTEDAVAWKDDYFDFKKSSIQTVMRQFARWYNVDVEYEGKTPTSMITGKVNRNVNASEALKILSYLDIHFRIENKKIIVTP